MQKTVHVLIIEDNEDDTILEIDELSRGGYNIIYEQIQTRQELEKALEKKKWDCIISDFSMPQFSGLEALIIARETGLDIPFILVSGAMGEETAVAAMKAGAHDYIMKSNLKRLLPAFERELREAEIRKQNKIAEETIRNERKLLRTLIDNLPDLIYVKDTSGKRIISNKADVFFRGFSSENELIGKTDVELLGETTGKQKMNDDMSILLTGDPMINREDVFTGADGRQRWMLSSKIPIRNNANKITGLVSIEHDITDRKLSELSLRESEQNLKLQNQEYQALNEEYLAVNEELQETIEHMQQINSELIVAKNKAEEADKLKSSFLANMSHEIRTPLNAILGFSSLLKNPELNQEKTNSFVDIIDSSGQQLLAIINDILDISKIEAGQISISNSRVNVSIVLNELYQQFEKQAEQKNIGLVMRNEYQKSTLEITTDEIRLRQIITNLLSNAIKFTHEGFVEFGVRSKEGYIEFFVKDTGIGISPADVAVIFEPFRQVENNNSRMYGGNGLGLSISKALVEKLGGTLSVQSEVEKGSTFSFTIPYKNGNPSKNNPGKQNPETKWDKHIILIAEDECYNYLFMEEILTPTGVKILHARDGKEAVELVKKYPQISLVLMDLKMPVMDGYTATRLIKEIKPRLPIIAQTAYAMTEDRVKTRDAGFDNFIAKPIVQEGFIKVLADYID
ncbi:MAG TPA: response regulator [Bacteroidales bacterium]|nr:response regulator [Bacteroidales bacterium]